MYIAYKTPVTQVICKGHGSEAFKTPGTQHICTVPGSVACYEGIYHGMSEFIGEVKESEKK